MTTQVIINSLVLGSSLALIAVGFTLAYGVMHIVNFAHGVFYMLGAYLVVIYYHDVGLPIGLAMLFAFLTVPLFAPVLYVLVYRRIFGNFMESILATFGLTLVIQGVVQAIQGPDTRTAPSYFSHVFNIGGASVTGERLVVVVAGIGLLIGLYFLVYRTKIGLGIRAVEQDRETASTYGVSITNASVVTLIVSFALAGAAGVLMSPLIFINPYIGDDAILLATAIVIIGGLGSVTGSLIAALMVGTIMSVSQTYFSVEIGRILFFSFAGLLLLVRPSGLMGYRMDRVET